MAVETQIDRGQWYIGSDFTFRVLVTSDGTAAGTPTTMTGYGLAFVVRQKDGDLILSKASGGNGISLVSVGGTNDAADVTIARADTLAQPEQWATWALWRTDTDRPLAVGTVYLTAAAAQA
jgi:hypothetical protein